MTDRPQRTHTHTHTYTHTNFLSLSQSINQSINPNISWFVRNVFMFFFYLTFHKTQMNASVTHVWTKDSVSTKSTLLYAIVLQPSSELDVKLHLVRNNTAIKCKITFSKSLESLYRFNGFTCLKVGGFHQKYLDELWISRAELEKKSSIILLLEYWPCTLFHYTINTNSASYCVFCYSARCM